MNTNAKKNILLVEDDALIAMGQIMKLKEYGYDVIHVQKGAKAIEAIVNHHKTIDLVLMDINLGEELDGTEIAKIILVDYDIPILFLSSHTEREIVDKTENITFYGYVVKDSGITVLDASIKMAFRLHDAYLSGKGQKIELETKEKEMKLYEKRYRRLFESAKDGILILNAEDGTIVDVNPFLINMLKYSKEQLLNKKIWDISAFKNIDYSKQLYKALQDIEYIRYNNLPLETSEGKTINVEFISNVYLVDNVKVIQCNIRDTTERVMYEKTLTTDIDEKKGLLREIQHRAKNSFNMITTMIHLRSMVTASEETKNILTELNLRVKSIADLYTLLYDTNSFYEVELKTYCSKIIASMLSFTKNIEINEQFEEITVTSKSAATVGMILVELLSNAVKYAFPVSQKGMINIELKVENSQIMLTVEDNGVGLKNDFDINEIKSLGLHLVNLMVSQLDGSIKFIPGNGTKVIIEFPLEIINSLVAA